MKWSEQLAASDATRRADPRPASRFARFHDRTREHDPDYMYEVLRLLTTPWILTVLRARIVGADHMPAHGPVIVASNHGSYLDHFIIGAFVRRRVHFMAKSQMFQFPSQWVYSHAGAFPVRRGLHDADAITTAMAILKRGGVLGIYGEGTRSAVPMASRPKPGVGRLALESGAPVIPIAICGSDRIRNWRHLEFPAVTVVRGEPMQWSPVAKPTADTAVTASIAIYREIERLHVGHGSRGGTSA